MNRAVVIISSILLMLLLSPILIYCWGLSNLEVKPVPSNIVLSPERELEIWRREYEEGQPKVKKINPYQYIAYVYCDAKNHPNSVKCKTSYPGLSFAAFAVRQQVGEQVHGKGNTIWQFTWMSYSIWATRNWNIHQILATYNETYDR